MKKRKKLAETDRLQSGVEMFSFGEPVPVMDKQEILNYLYCSVNQQKWYNTPISWEGLAKSLRASTHHESAITVKANLLADTCEITRPDVLSRKDLVSFIKDYYIFGKPKRIFYLDLFNANLRTNTQICVSYLTFCAINSPR